MAGALGRHPRDVLHQRHTVVAVDERLHIPRIPLRLQAKAEATSKDGTRRQDPVRPLPQLDADGCEEAAFEVRAAALRGSDAHLLVHFAVREAGSGADGLVREVRALQKLHSGIAHHGTGGTESAVPGAQASLDTLPGREPKPKGRHHRPALRGAQVRLERDDIRRRGLSVLRGPAKVCDGDVLRMRHEHAAFARVLQAIAELDEARRQLPHELVILQGHARQGGVPGALCSNHGRQAEAANVEQPNGPTRGGFHAHRRPNHVPQHPGVLRPA
mmetsp:Transcript_9867/g.28990  ORF Transcript_9867/g.28990 Transcript_9867/m.28990 type:complete len:273 (+) Transcript_9867:1819-2637(+)